MYTDIITTVSPSYAEEIQTAYYGERLDGLLKARKQSLFGLLNGIDVVDYNPATDKAIAATYTPDDLSGKAVCKKALQEKLGLKVDPDVPIIGMVGRLSNQKGLDPVSYTHLSRCSTPSRKTTSCPSPMTRWCTASTPCWTSSQGTCGGSSRACGRCTACLLYTSRCV